MPPRQRPGPRGLTTALGGSPFSLHSEGSDMSSDIQVTVFSNGMADVRRTERLDGDGVRRISIPVKTSDVADVLASLCVYGDVALSAPATSTAIARGSREPASMSLSSGPMTSTLPSSTSSMGLVVTHSTMWVRPPPASR